MKVQLGCVGSVVEFGSSVGRAAFVSFSVAFAVRPLWGRRSFSTWRPHRALRAGEISHELLEVAATDYKCPLMSRLLGVSAAVGSSMKIFTDVDEARGWLDSLAVRRHIVG